MPRAATKKRTRTRDIVAPGRREQVIDAARRVIGRRGYHRASMDEIADVAGLAKSTVYVYFTSKQEILAHAFEAGHAQLRARIESRLAGADSAEDTLRVLVAALLGHVDDNASFFRAVASLTRDDPAAEGMMPLGEYEADFGGPLRAALGAGVASGELPAHDTERAVTTFGALILGAVALRAYRLSNDTAADEATRLVDIFLHGIGG